MKTALILLVVIIAVIVIVEGTGDYYGKGGGDGGDGDSSSSRSGSKGSSSRSGSKGSSKSSSRRTGTKSTSRKTGSKSSSKRTGSKSTSKSSKSTSKSTRSSGSTKSGTKPPKPGPCPVYVKGCFTCYDASSKADCHNKAWFERCQSNEDICLATYDNGYYDRRCATWDDKKKAYYYGIFESFEHKICPPPTPAPTEKPTEPPTQPTDPPTPAPEPTPGPVSTKRPKKKGKKKKGGKKGKGNKGGNKKQCPDGSKKGCFTCSWAPSVEGCKAVKVFKECSAAEEKCVMYYTFDGEVQSECISVAGLESIPAAKRISFNLKKCKSEY